MKWIIPVFFLNTLFAQVPEGANEYQEKKWLEMESFVNQVTDGLGLPVDEGIKDTVLALNLLGFETCQSCEGHLERGCPYPWVDFPCPDELIELHRRKNNLCDQFTANNSKETHDEIWSVWALINQAEERFEKRIWTLLEEFYDGRESVAPETIVFDGRFNRLFPVGGMWQNRYSEEKRAENLALFQREMKRFEEFLVSKYLVLCVKSFQL